tara:strand:+ start:96 stop:527 length:432 start_codon:yes stop_codon:yes gene_type:complete
MNSSAETSIDVGNVVYFIAAKSQTVIPGLVCEKIVRTSIDGSSKVNYVLEVRVKEGMKRVEVDPLKSVLFPTSEAVETHLIEGAVSHIKQIVADAVQNADAWQSPEDHSPAPENDKSQPIPQPSASESTVVDLGDGTVARLKM